MSVVLTTDRLILRQPAPRDEAAAAAFWASERSHLMGGPWSPELFRAEMDEVYSQWQRHGFSLFAVTLKGSDQAIGFIGPYFRASHSEPELGWSLWDKALEGQGIAHEAASAARDWFFGHTSFTTAVSITDAVNHRSHRLCERLGAHVDEAAVSPYPVPAHALPDVIYRHHAAQDKR